ncbi:MAG TPA: enoyl-CoA hydratase-related protein [Steroidobacteraceae bacterium]|nr:enoyl-CoA hydratase-related protein [Steroidobacteraceae bacterium]
MSEAVITGRPEKNVAVVTINRPEARNAVNGAVAEGLAAAVALTELDPAIRVVILTGAGDAAFCAGADLKEVSASGFSSLLTAEGGYGGFVRATRRKPWIAAVNGVALAGGMELALACDMIVAAEDALFGLPEVKRGLAALAGGLYLLPRVFPRALALEIIATGEPITAACALAHGLVNRVVSKRTVLDAALSLAQRIAVNAPFAVRESLLIARAAFDKTQSELEELSDALRQRLMQTEDFQEGMAAFMEKREPRWTGR